jgi:predicted PurR-regulated permease PerM
MSGTVGPRRGRRVVLGNIVTSVVARGGHHGLADDLSVPYYILFGLFVAIFDLIPVVGSTIAGIVVSLLALTKSLSVAIATGGFYAFYRLFEDYLLVPRVMNRTVGIQPGLTTIATSIGATLWRLFGALVAIPNRGRRAARSRRGHAPGHRPTLS